MKIPEAGYDFLSGATLLVNKPHGWTSFDVVNKIRFKLKHKLGVKKIKVGHAGTLDPMATGLLIICTGKFTKKLHEFQGFDKTYTGKFLLGGTTPSYDAETPVDQEFPTDHITDETVRETAAGFLGEQEQVPPMYSAVKVDGQPLYKKARKGETVERKSRVIRIKEFEITSIRIPEVQFRVTCSKGTYIRTLAYDFGKRLGSGSYLTGLVRTSIGEFSLEDAWELEELVNYLSD